MSSTSENFPLAGDGSDGGADIDPNVAGASGTSTGGLVLSRGALIAIIVVVVVVALVGSTSNPNPTLPLPSNHHQRKANPFSFSPCSVASSVLFFVAKKREWTVRETIRRSARKVVTVLTPRRSEFPKSVKEGGGGGRAKFDDVPPTPRIKPEYLDLEKGLDGSSKKKKKGPSFGRKG